MAAPPLAPMPAVSMDDVNACALSSWLAQFRPHTIKTRLLPLDPLFEAFLGTDGVVLPASASKHDADGTSDSGDDDSDTWSDHDEAAVCEFPELEKQVQEAISDLGGAVLPKLNWSAPKDSAWMLPNSELKSTSFADIVLLLKSSDFIAHDLERVYDICGEIDPTLRLPQTLALRKWYDFQPSTEFRCFVYNRCLIGISQRDYTTVYPFLVALTAEHKLKICSFFEETVRTQFPLQSYVFDVYIERSGRVWLVDFAPFHSKTDGLLFEYSELLSNYVDRFHSLDNAQMLSAAEISPIVEYRLLDPETAILPSSSASFRLPRDVVDVTTTEAVIEVARQIREAQLEEEMAKGRMEEGIEK